jgi:hypothetical protein
MFTNISLKWGQGNVKIKLEANFKDLLNKSINLLIKGYILKMIFVKE